VSLNSSSPMSSGGKSHEEHQVDRVTRAEASLHRQNLECVADTACLVSLRGQLVSVLMTRTAQALRNGTQAIRRRIWKFDVPKLISDNLLRAKILSENERCRRLSVNLAPALPTD